jgi:hypothetical protein
LLKTLMPSNTANTIAAFIQPRPLRGGRGGGGVSKGGGFTGIIGGGGKLCT